MALSLAGCESSSWNYIDTNCNSEATNICELLTVASRQIRISFAAEALDLSLFLYHFLVGQLNGVAS